MKLKAAPLRRLFLPNVHPGVEEKRSGSGRLNSSSFTSVSSSRQEEKNGEKHKQGAEISLRPPKIRLNFTRSGVINYRTTEENKRRSGVPPRPAAGPTFSRS